MRLCQHQRLCHFVRFDNLFENMSICMLAKSLGSVKERKRADIIADRVNVVAVGNKVDGTVAEVIGLGSEHVLVEEIEIVTL